jgi:DNA-binding PadR family transcriptional regulator
MISVPRGMLKLAALKMFSQSSLSGSDLQREINKYSTGIWNPGPGSIYFLLAELRKKELVAELPRHEGTTRKYVITRKGRDELSRLSKDVEREVGKQLELLSLYSRLTGNEEIHERLRKLVGEIHSRQE